MTLIATKWAHERRKNGRKDGEELLWGLNPLIDLKRRGKRGERR
jgi:hypothetical protein